MILSTLKNRSSTQARTTRKAKSSLAMIVPARLREPAVIRFPAALQTKALPLANPVMIPNRVILFKVLIPTLVCQ